MLLYWDVSDSMLVWQWESFQHPQEDDSAGSVFGDGDEDIESLPGDEAGLQGGTCFSLL